MGIIRINDRYFLIPVINNSITHFSYIMKQKLRPFRISRGSPLFGPHFSPHNASARVKALWGEKCLGFAKTICLISRSLYWLKATLMRIAMTVCPFGLVYAMHGYYRHFRGGAGGLGAGVEAPPSQVNVNL